MKKIIIIDGGPRRNMNTAQMLQKFAEGVKSAGNDTEVRTIRLYDLDYKGCTVTDPMAIMPKKEQHQPYEFSPTIAMFVSLRPLEISAVPRLRTSSRHCLNVTFLTSLS